MLTRCVLVLCSLLYLGSAAGQEAVSTARSAPIQVETAPCCNAIPQLKLNTSGFLRLGYSAILQDDQSPDFVGQNDGFFVESARLNLDFSSAAISGRMSVDGAVDEYDSRNTAEGRVSVSLLDAFFDYSVGQYLKIRGGQFRPEFDLEAARIRKDMVFVYRALYNRGIRGVEGFNVSGLGLTREVGMAVHGDFGPATSFHGAYQVSVTNGVSADESVNDNDVPAVGSRVTLGYAKLLTVGFGARYNRRTTGTPPDLIDQDELSLTADIQLMRTLGAYRIVLEGALSQKQIDVVDVESEPSTTKLGYHGAVMLSRGALTLAYRYAAYDPTAAYSETNDAQLADAFDADTLVHQTIGLSYTPDSGPLTLQANFTIAQENAQRAYANDRLDLLAQLVF